MVFGGDERIRTADLPRAKRSLCQLSYTPMNNQHVATRTTHSINKLAYGHQYPICNIAYSPRMVKNFNHQTYYVWKIF